ncbi:MAG: hypothetical protein JXN59_00825 [Anaerolineae bacterium]|nr:hypothetical protein [Anaerolineae bacterium]
MNILPKDASILEIVIALLGIWGGVLSSYLAVREIRAKQRKLRFECNPGLYMREESPGVWVSHYDPKSKQIRSIKCTLVNEGNHEIKLHRIYLKGNRKNSNYNLDAVGIPGVLLPAERLDFEIKVNDFLGVIYGVEAQFDVSYDFVGVCVEDTLGNIDNAKCQVPSF